jgi:hypothetical protein
MANVVDELRAAMGKAYVQLREQAKLLERLTEDRALVQQELMRQAQELRHLAGLTAGVQVNRTGSPEQGLVHLNGEDRLRYIEDIPGRRIPFDLLVSIPLGPDVVSTQPQTVTISQDGPFVAVARYAVFRSSFRFSKVVDGQRLDFLGRSNGRFRPIHSMCDLNDSQAFQPVVGLANPGTGGPVYASPSNHCGFRSMEWDGTIELVNSGSGFFRSNAPVPSPFWTDHINSCFQLGSFDFFERGETLQFKATPLHANNFNGGNVAGFLGGLFPGLSSQFDVHEGILDEYDEELTEDPVTRSADGTLEVGLHGFRIIMAPGPVRF